MPITKGFLIILNTYKFGIIVALLDWPKNRMRRNKMTLFPKKPGVIVLAILSVFLFWNENIQAASPIWTSPDLSNLIEEGLTNNKEIQSLQAQVESLKEEIPFAGSLEDIRLGLAILNLPADSFSFEREPMTQKQISLAQKIPWFGKLDLRSQRTALKAVRQEAVLGAKRFELTRKIAATYYQLGFVAAGLKINARLTDIVNQLLRVAETRYATGRGLQQDVLQAQVELSKLLDEKIILRKKRRTLENRVNELLNRESFSPVIPPQDLSFPGLQLDVKELQDRATKENPGLRIRLSDINLAAVEIELARKDYWPDMDFKVAYGQRDEDRTGRSLPDFVSGSVTINLPVWKKYRQDPKLAATLKNHDATLKSYQNLLLSLPHRVDALATEIQDFQENYRLFTDALIVQADQWANSSLAAYEVGSLEFNTMINSQIRLLRFELKAENYLFNIYEKRAELEEVLGGPLSGLSAKKK
jgi:outer membrane protein TolC